MVVRRHGPGCFKMVVIVLRGNHVEQVSASYERILGRALSCSVRSEIVQQEGSLVTSENSTLP